MAVVFAEAGFSRTYRPWSGRAPYHHASSPCADRGSPSPPGRVGAAPGPRGDRSARHRGIGAGGPGAGRAVRARCRADRHPARRGLGHRSDREAGRRRPGTPDHALHGLERDRPADQRPGLRRPRLRAQGRRAERAHDRADDRRRGRDVRRPAPAPRAALTPRDADAEVAVQARARDHGTALAGPDRRAGGGAALPLARDDQDPHPQRDEQARGQHACPRDRDRAARGLHLTADRRPL